MAAPAIFETGTFTSVAGPQDVTLSKFTGVTPKAVIIWHSGQTADGVSSGAKFGFGAATSGTQGAFVLTSEDGQGTSDADRYRTDSNVLTLLDYSRVTIEEASVALASGKFVVTYGTSLTGVKYNYLAIGGTDVEASLLQVNSPTSPATSDYAHGLSSTPDALIGFGAAEPSSPFVQGQGSVAISAGATYRSLACRAQDAAATTVTNRQLTSRFFNNLSGSSSSPFLAGSSVVADSTNVSVVWDISSAARRHFILCLKGVSAEILTTQQPASDSTTSNAVSFVPKAVLGITAMGATSASIEDDARIGVGASDFTSEAFSGAVDEDNQGTTDSDSVQSSSAFIKHIDHAQNVVGTCTLNINGTSVDEVWTDCDTTQRETSYLVFGDPVQYDPTFEAGTFTSTAGPQDVTLSKFTGQTPRAVIIWHSGQTADGVSSGAKFGFGAATSAGQFAICNTSEDAQGTSDTDRRSTNAATLTLLNYAQAVIEEGSVALSSGKFVVTYGTSLTGIKYNYLAIGGTDVEASVVEFQSPASASLQAIPHTLSEAPTAAFISSMSSNTAATNTQDSIATPIALIDSSSLQSGYFKSTNGQATTSTTRALFNKVRLGLSGNDIGELSSVDTTNVNINWTTADASQRYCWLLAISGVSAEILTTQQPAADSTTNNTTSFIPKAALGVTAMAATSAAVGNDARIGVGASDFTSEGFAGAVDENGQATSDADSVQSSTAFIKHIDHTQTVVGTCTLSVNGTSIDEVWTDCDTTQRETSYLVFGDPIHYNPTFEAGTFTSTAGPQDVTLSKFTGVTPKAVIIWHSGQTADGVSSGAKFGFGASDGTTQGCIHATSENAQGTTDTDRYYSDTNALTLLDYAQTVIEEGSVALSSGKFVVTYGTSLTGVKYNYLAIGGTDVEAALLEVLSPGSATTANYAHGLASTPTAIIGFANGKAAPAGVGTTLAGSVAISDASGYKSLGVRSQNSQATSNAIRQLSTGFFTNFNAAADSHFEAGDSVSADSTNVSVVWGTSSTTRPHFILVIAGISTAVLTTQQPASDSTTSNAVSFVPKAVLGVTAMAATSASIVNDARVGVGASDFTSEGFAGAVDEDAQATTDADSVQSSTAFIKHIDHTQTVVGTCTLTLNGNTISEVWTDCDTTQRETSYLVLGALRVGGSWISAS